MIGDTHTKLFNIHSRVDRKRLNLLSPQIVADYQKSLVSLLPHMSSTKQVDALNTLGNLPVESVFTEDDLSHPRVENFINSLKKRYYRQRMMDNDLSTLPVLENLFAILPSTIVRDYYTPQLNNNISSPEIMSVIFNNTQKILSNLSNAKTMLENLQQSKVPNPFIQMTIDHHLGMLSLLEQNNFNDLRKDPTPNLLPLDFTTMKTNLFTRGDVVDTITEIENDRLVKHLDRDLLLNDLAEKVLYDKDNETNQVSTLSSPQGQQEIQQQPTQTQPSTLPQEQQPQVAPPEISQSTQVPTAPQPFDYFTEDYTKADYTKGIKS